MIRLKSQEHIRVDHIVFIAPMKMMRVVVITFTGWEMMVRGLMVSCILALTDLHT